MKRARVVSILALAVLLRLLSAPCLAEEAPAAAAPDAARPAEVKAQEPVAAGEPAKAPEGKEAEKPAAVSEAAKPEEKPAAPQVSPNAPVAIVNGTPIPRAEFDRALQAYLQNFRMMSGDMHGKVLEPNEVMKGAVVEQLVSRELLYQESLKFPDQELDKKTDEQIKEIEARFPNAETFQEALKGQGLTGQDLRDLVRKQVSVQHYVESQVAPKAVVSDEDAKKFYDENKESFAVPEQVKASHILVRADEGAKPEEKEKAKAKAQDLQKRAAAGEDFTKLAQENSEDPGSASEGGDLGYFTKDRMVAPFAEAAFALKTGEVSGVVETQFGYHVIKTTDHKEAGTVAFDEVKENIAAYLKGRALDQAVQGKVEELRKASKVEVVAPHL